MRKTISKMRHLVAVGMTSFLLMILLILILPTKSFAGDVLLQSIATPAVYLPVISNGAPSPITQPQNHPPSLDAGPTQTITLHSNALLDGTVSDDGLPNPPAQVTTSWSQVSGPGTVNFGNSTLVDTTATFSEAGTYVLRLTANDGALIAFDEVAITVQNAPSIRRIAFTSSRGGSRDVYLMNADGTGIINLTNNPAFDAGASWSPDGTKIAFVSDRDNQGSAKTEIYVMTADGSGQTRLTNNSSSEYALAWSPDGTKIAFVSDQDGNNKIYVMNADGSGQTQLTHNAQSDWGPSWSPDGARIAYGSNGDIYVMNADGSNQIRLTTSPVNESEPAWSPNGAKIAYSHDNAIWLMNVDGSDQAELTSSPNYFDFDPAWSPDGDQIAFASFLNSSTDDVFIVNIDGSGRTNITNNQYNDLEPEWHP